MYDSVACQNHIKYNRNVRKLTNVEGLRCFFCQQVKALFHCMTAIRRPQILVAMAKFSPYVVQSNMLITITLQENTQLIEDDDNDNSYSIITQSSGYKGASQKI